MISESYRGQSLWELQNCWTLDMVLDAHILLDEVEKIREQQAKEQPQRSESSAPKRKGFAISLTNG